jgi:putative thioredoxin
VVPRKLRGTETVEEGMSNYLEVSDQTFQTDVVEKSHEAPVVVDFWAAWCGPCRALTPVLEKLADEADGSWILAKVDVDANQRVAGSMGIQGIPAVKAFKDGRVVAEFTGALPEPHVRNWLAQLGPSRADLLVEEGIAAEARGDLETAADRYREAVGLDPFNKDAGAALGRVELLLRANGNEDELRQRLQQNPEDVDASLALSDVLAARDSYEEAANLLIEGVRATTGSERERLRSHLVGLLDTLPADDPRAKSARRRLALVLF